MWVRHAGSTAAWEAYRTTGYFTVGPPTPVTTTPLVATPSLPATTGTPVLFTATASGGVGPLQYQFYLLEPRTGWRILQGWSAARSVTWTPLVAGTYNLQVWVRSAGSTAAYEAWTGTGNFTVANGPLTVAGIDANRPLPIGVGGTVGWHVATAGGDGTPLEYQFFRYRISAGTWTVAQAYSASPDWSWTPGAGDVGPYALQVWVRRQGAVAAWEAWANTASFGVTAAPLAVALTSTQGEVPKVPAARPITWRASATGANGPLEYAFFRWDAQTGTWSQVRAYGPSDSYTWTPTQAEAGQYLLQVWARTVGSAQAYNAWAGTDYFAIQP